MTTPPNGPVASVVAVAKAANTHRVGFAGIGSIAVAFLAILMVGFKPAIDDHLVGSGFWIEASRGTYDAFVTYFAFPVIATLVAAGGLLAYLGRPITR